MDRVLDEEGNAVYSLQSTFVCMLYLANEHGKEQSIKIDLMVTMQD